MGLVSLLDGVVAGSCFDELSKRLVIDEVEQGKEIAIGVLATREERMPCNGLVHVRLTHYCSQRCPVRSSHRDHYRCHRSSSVRMKPPVEDV